MRSDLSCRLTVSCIAFGVFLLSTVPAIACPNCNIHNYLYEAVQTCETIAIGTVVGTKQGREYEISIAQPLKGPIKLGQSGLYQEQGSWEPSPGTSVIAFGPSQFGQAVDRGILPIDLLPEILKLMEKNYTPATAIHAAECLTAVSADLHYQGVDYYKANPLEVQETLKNRLASLESSRKNSLGYTEQQYRFGLVAIMKVPSATAEEIATGIIDEFLTSNSPRTRPGELIWTLSKLETLFSAIREEKYASLKAVVSSLLPSLSGHQLSLFSQCLIVSGLMSPQEIVTCFSNENEHGWIKQAIALAACRHLGTWDSKTAIQLIAYAETLPGEEAAEALAAAKEALQASHHWLKRPVPGLDETPWDAGWAVESILFSAAEWDKWSSEALAKRSSWPLTSVALLLLVGPLIWMLSRLKQAKP
ncbi:MAG: hypothetical protein V4599_00300 [Verrucomicrobiota bacterium]